MQQILESSHNFGNYFSEDGAVRELAGIEVFLLCAILLGLFFVSLAV